MAICRSMEDQNSNSNRNIDDSFVLAQQQSYFYQTLEERAPLIYKNTPSLLSSTSSKEIKKAVFNNHHGKPMVSSRTQKKFVCKILSNNGNSLQELPKKYICLICGKRFVRPGSLTTHTYSHTGEKPFQCAVEGCGRRFSVVSNLRRHGKIHNVKKKDPQHNLLTE